MGLSQIKPKNGLTLIELNGLSDRIGKMLTGVLLPIDYRSNFQVWFMVSHSAISFVVVFNKKNNKKKINFNWNLCNSQIVIAIGIESKCHGFFPFEMLVELDFWSDEPYVATTYVFYKSWFSTVRLHLMIAY